MPFILRNLTLPFDHPAEALSSALCVRFNLRVDAILSLQVLKQGLDARKKPRVKAVYSVQFTVADEAAFWQAHGGDPDLDRAAEPVRLAFPRLQQDGRIVIVGMGPAGLFAALRLTEYGLRPIVVERGRPVEERLKDVQTFWSRGLLEPESNVQFGEGGAGTFSDGKLTTRVRDPNLGYVLEQLVRFGAPPEIISQAKPHIGTDRLREVVTGIRGHLLDQGADIRFRWRLTGLLAEGGRIRGVTGGDGTDLACDFLVMAPGHSARDTYRLLLESGVSLERKPFAVGVRVEHPQELINRIQYAIASHPRLPAADYRLAYNNGTNGRSAYSFCMCPGGVVVAGASAPGQVVTNGMSNLRRNAPYANSALVVNVREEDFPDSSPLAGVAFQEALEQRAFRAGGGGYLARALNLLAFVGGLGGGGCRSSYRPGVVETELGDLLPGFVTDTLREGLVAFDRQMRGFVSAEATLVAVESRTSAPVRILRGSDLQSVSHRRLYPAGEGAGYAGGIMSAALDGIRVADAIAGTIMAGDSDGIS